VYVGQSTESLKERKRKHIVRAKKGDRRGAFQIALLALGFSSFTWEQIDTANNKEELDAKEKQWIRHYQSDNPAHGYNGTDGGINTVLSPATRRKISESQKGEKGYWYGKHLSEEHRRNIGKAHKGKKKPPMSAETRRKMSQARTGRKGTKWSPEQRRKISAALKGHTTSEATRQKISTALKSKGILPPWIKNR
jgi:group I intron endonuclease